MCGARIRLAHALFIGPFIVWAAITNRTTVLTALGVAVSAAHLTLLIRDKQLVNWSIIKENHPLVLGYVGSPLVGGAARPKRVSSSCSQCEN
jgi:hypothetical protein